MGDPQDYADEPPSKSELKRQSRDLQDLGQALVDLPAAEFDALPVPEDLRDAIVAARRITSHGARVRQRLYIGKLLRNIDPEPIREALANRAEVDRQRVRREHAIEAWRDRLLADGARRTGRRGQPAPAPLARAPGQGRTGCGARTVGGASTVPPTARVAVRRPRLRGRAAGATMPR